MKQTASQPKPASTINEVLEQLDDIINQSILNNDYLCLFTFIYRETTAEIKRAIQNGRFEDPRRMEKMDVIFANLFISAWYAYQNDEPTSRSWQFAFKVKKEPLAFVQHIMLGMNAHINLDLSVAAAEVSQGENIMDLKNDFMIINQILAELTNKMQQDLGRVSFLMLLLDLFGFRSDEKIINFSIRKARDFAWLNAVELSLQDKEGQIKRRGEIDLRVLEISEMIKNPPGKILFSLLKFISLFESNNKEMIIKNLQRDQA
jgi:hypothetical protein